MTAPPHHHDRHRLLHHKLTMPAAARYYQSDDPALDFWEDTDVPALSPPRTARARPASPSRTATPSPEAALKAGSASSPSASASAAEPHRPLACVVPPSLVAEREDMERQRAWRSARWNELHYHHKDSLAQELEKRILLLIWITVELCLCIVLLVLRVDDFGAVVGCGMFLVTLCGYLITQLRLHTLTFTFLCLAPTLLLLQLFYALYCMVHLRLGLFDHHAYVFLLGVSSVVLGVCEWVARRLYVQEERSEDWARQESELDDLIVKTTRSEYIAMAHRVEHHETDSCFV